MALTLVTPPAADPVSLEEMKLHLRVSHEDEDDLIVDCIQAATGQCEAFTNRQFVTATWKWTGYGFPERLPKAPLQSVSLVRYRTAAASWTTVTDYVLDGGDPAGFSPVYGTYWPIPYTHPEAVEVTFVAGYGAASAVPADLRHAVRLLAANLYEWREPPADADMASMMRSVEWLLWKHRLVGFA